MKQSTEKKQNEDERNYTLALQRSIKSARQSSAARLNFALFRS